CSVRRPWSVRVDSIRYVGIAAPPFPSRPRLYCRTRRLVVVQKRCADEEQRRDNEAGEEDRDALRLLAAAAQQEVHDRLRQEDDDRQRRQRAERVDVVGAAELQAAAERAADRETLADGRRNRQA